MIIAAGEAGRLAVVAITSVVVGVVAGVLICERSQPDVPDAYNQWLADLAAQEDAAKERGWSKAAYPSKQKPDTALERDAGHTDEAEHFV